MSWLLPAKILRMGHFPCVRASFDQRTFFDRDMGGGRRSNKWSSIIFQDSVPQVVSVDPKLEKLNHFRSDKAKKRATPVESLFFIKFNVAYSTINVPICTISLRGM